MKLRICSKLMDTVFEKQEAQRGPNFKKLIFEIFFQILIQFFFCRFFYIMFKQIINQFKQFSITRGPKGVKFGIFTYLTVELLLFIVLRWGLFYFIANKIAQV